MQIPGPSRAACMCKPHPPAWPRPTHLPTHLRNQELHRQRPPKRQHSCPGALHARLIGAVLRGAGVCVCSAKGGSRSSSLGIRRCANKKNTINPGVWWHSWYNNQTGRYCRYGGSKGQLAREKAHYHADEPRVAVFIVISPCHSVTGALFTVPCSRGCAHHQPYAATPGPCYREAVAPLSTQALLPNGTGSRPLVHEASQQRPSKYDYISPAPT